MVGNALNGRGRCRTAFGSYSRSRCPKPAIKAVIGGRIAPVAGRQITPGIPVISEKFRSFRAYIAAFFVDVAVPLPFLEGGHPYEQRIPLTLYDAAVFLRLVSDGVLETASVFSAELRKRVLGYIEFVANAR